MGGNRMAKSTMNSEEVIQLLSKLKTGTPDYPSDLLAARKAAFIKQAVTIKIDGKGQSGGNGGSGGSGAASGSGFATQGFLWQALIGFLVLSAILLTAFAYRDKIADFSSKNESIALVEDALISSDVSTTAVPVSNPSPLLVPKTTAIPSETSEPLLSVSDAGSPEGGADQGLHLGQTPGTPDVPAGTKDNPGLHLGQTPGTPAAPGQGNPGNINKPEKPDKPDKPEKPDNPNKPDK